MIYHGERWTGAVAACLLALLALAGCTDREDLTAPSWTAADSAAFLAGRAARVGAQPGAEAVAAPVTINAGETAVITITSAHCSGIGDILTVSGALSGTISTDACRDVGRQAILGPAAATGTLSFTLTDRNYGSGYFVGIGSYPSYKVIVEDGFGDQDNNDNVLSVEILRNCQMNVERLSQGGGAPWANDAYDNVPGKSIANLGCALASLAMALTQAGVPVTPRELNDHMKTHDGFSSSGAVLWDVTARSIGPLGFKYRGSNAVTFVQLARQLCDSGKPLIVGVKLDANGNPHHFVVATGFENGHINIADPGYEQRTFLDDAAYQNKFSVRGSVGDPPGDISGLDISVTDADLLVVDPFARATGLQFASGQKVVQILQSSYAVDALDDDVSGEAATSSTAMVNIFQPFDGTYQIQVRGTRAGTHEIRIDGFCADGSAQPIIRIPVDLAVGQVATFNIEYSACVPSVPMVYFSMDENNGAIITGQGRVAPVLNNNGRATAALPAHSGLGRTLNNFNAFFAEGTISASTVNIPFVTIPAQHSWTVAVWFNKDLGYWGSGAGGGDFAGTGPYNLSAAFLLGPPGQSDVGAPWAVVYPLNWLVFTSPTDVSPGSVELALYYRDAAGTNQFVHTGFFANELLPTSSGWHHLAVVDDLNGNTLTFYVDGAVVHTQAALDVSTFGSGSTKGQIMWKEVGNNSLFNNAWGSMDELYIFDRALSAAEMRALGIMP